MVVAIATCTLCAQSGHPEDGRSVPFQASALIGRRGGAVESDESDDGFNVLATGVASYARYSSDLQDSRSITDQQRKCRDRAGSLGFVVDRSLELYDEAISGAKHHRAGFEALMAAARRGEVKVVLFENLSRLARDVGLTINTLKELVYRHKVRIISIDDGIDTQTNQQWEYITVILGVQNEQYLKMLAKFVHRGQEGIVLDGLCVGDYCFGYSSEPIADQVSRRGKNSKPKKKYVIVPEHAAWVVCIFQWFAVERRSLRWITRELNKNNAPKDHRSSTPKWHHQQLRGVLSNRKYIGEWSWGRRKNERDPISGAIRQVERSPAEYEKWHRTLPELKVIDEETFSRAQVLLAESASALAGVRRTDASSGKQKGHLCGAASQASERWPRHLLSGLIVCGECGRKFQVGGNMSRYMACPGYAIGECSCRTTLRRELAEHRVLNEICNRLLADPLVVVELLRSVQEAWREIAATRPADTLTLEQKLGEVKRRIEKLMNLCETEDSPDLTQRLRARCAERDALQQKLAQFSSSSCISLTPPTEEWIVSQLSSVREVVSGKGPAAHAALRELVDGRIVAQEVKTPGRSRFYHRLKFDIQLYVALGSQAFRHQALKGLGVINVELSVREPPQYEALAEQIKADFDAGFSIAEIETKHCCSYTIVDKAMNYWHEVHNVPRPDGRSLRKRLPKNRQCDRLMGEIMQLWQEDLSVKEVAARLDCGMETIRAAVVAWHESRGLPIPDGRERRKQRRLAREKEFRDGNDE